MQLVFACCVLLSCHIISFVDSLRPEYEEPVFNIPVHPEHKLDTQEIKPDPPRRSDPVLNFQGHPEIKPDPPRRSDPDLNFQGHPEIKPDPPRRSESRQFRHDYVYRREAKGWFKFHAIPATWENARAKCFHEGAVLASPITKQLHSAMQDFLKDQGHMAFTGVQSLTSTGDYFSLEGVHLIQMPVEWRTDEPNNVGGEEHCLAMWRDGTVADVRCSDTRAFICYKNKTKDLVMNTCGTTDKGYLEVAPGQCYKYHPDCVDWRRAHMICSSEGGHLAIVNSHAEARLLHELFANKFQATVKCGEKMFMHFGFRNPDGQTTGAPYWFTVQGQTLEEAGFSTWGPGQPDNFANQEYCGSAFFRNTSGEHELALNDVGCSYKASFICEINGPRIPYEDEEHIPL